MKNIFQTFVTALVVGLVCYVGWLMIQQQKDVSNWRITDQRLSQEADKVSENIEKTTKKVGRVAQKLSEEFKDDNTTPGANTPPAKTITPDARTGGGTTTTPPAPKNTATPTAPPATTPKTPPASTTSPAATTTTTGSNNNAPFFIQLAMVKNTAYNPAAYQALADLGVVSTEPAPNNYKRILLGTFYGRLRAEQILAITKQRGFADAFIIPATGGKPAPAAPATPKTPTFANRLSTSSYVVQLAAMRTPDAKNLQKLRQWGTVYYEYAADRDITKILVGPYAAEADAQLVTQNAKNNGYPNAFARRLTVADLANIEEVK